MSNYRIAILLATYNSVQYLGAQLDSLFAQTYPHFTLYIRDDGSTDRTLELVSEYQSKHENIVVLDDPQKGRRSMGSFMWLLDHAEAEYYMFCDHDDYWLPTKTEQTFKAMQCIEKYATERAVVVATDLQVVDENLELIAPSFWHYARLNPSRAYSFGALARGNVVTGCTMMINAAAKNCAFPVSEHALMHDHWIPLRVLACGGVVELLPEQTICYRQHASNVLGAVAGKGFDLKSKLCALSHVWAENRRHYMQAKAANKRYNLWRYIGRKLNKG